MIFTSASDNNANGLVLVLGEETAPIRCYDTGDEDYSIAYTSLTNLMLANIHWNYPKLSNFTGADFRRGDFRSLQLHKAILKGANFENADFRGADLTYTNFDGANLKGAN